jgi:hypothetical protein
MVTFGPLGAVRLHSGEVVSSGFGPLDRLLPAGGVRRGSLLEWIGEDDASGALTLAFAVACRLSGVVHGAAATRASTIVVIDRLGRFHPPAVMGWLPAAASGGPEERRLVVARVSSAVDEAWAVDQALRCRGVAAVLACPQSIHPTAMRRWQLAARASQAVGLFVRPQTAGGQRQERRQPTWAEARISVSPLPGESIATRRLRLALTGGPWAGEQSVEDRAVEIGIDLARGGEACGPEAGGIRIFQSQAAQPAEVMACRAS